MGRATTALVRARPRRRPLSIAQDATLVLVSLAFFYANGARALDGAATSAGLALEQALLVGIFLTRRPSFSTSSRTFDWIVATGSWLPLLMRPAHSPSGWAAVVGSSVQLVGLGGVCLTFAYLGRSFGIVAANRGLKIGGPYRLVRHPIYLAHTLTASGFVLANFSPVNLTILCALTICQVLRLRAEERILTATDDYASYASRVKWRLIPGIY